MQPVSEALALVARYSTPPRALPEPDMAQEALGEQFDIRAFHDTVLGAGAVPLDQLEANVQQLIQTTLASST